MNRLEDRKWKAETLEDIFDVRPGKRLENRNKTEGNRPFIGATDNKNGVTGFVSNENSSLDKNTLGVNYNGAPCLAYYHPYECIFTDDVKHLHLNNRSDSQESLLAFVPIFAKQKCKYNYGYKFNENRMRRQKLFVPVDNEEKPDYEFMENYTTDKMCVLLERYKKFIETQIEKLEHKDIPALSDVGWKTFKIGDLFDVSRPKARNKDDYEEGDIPFVASGAVNNGVMKCCTPEEDEELDEGNQITVSPVDGSTFYQPLNFLGRGGAGSSILMLKNENLNVSNGLFMARMIEQTCSKYTYGHMGNQESIKRESIMLPTTSNSTPDWEYMEQYAKNMMLQKYKQYLNFLDAHKM